MIVYVCPDMPRKKGFQHRKKKERQLRQNRKQATSAASENACSSSGAGSSPAAQLNVILPSSSWVVQESSRQKNILQNRTS